LTIQIICENVTDSLHPKMVPLRGYWSLELIFLDEISANQGVGDIIEISQFVELAFSLRSRCAKTILYAYTPPHLRDTRGPKPKW
jgi:hypothetical protein